MDQGACIDWMFARLKEDWSTCTLGLGDQETQLPISRNQNHDAGTGVRCGG